MCIDFLRRKLLGQSTIHCWLQILKSSFLASWVQISTPGFHHKNWGRECAGPKVFPSLVFDSREGSCLGPLLFFFLHGWTVLGLSGGIFILFGEALLGWLKYMWKAVNFFCILQMGWWEWLGNRDFSTKRESRYPDPKGFFLCSLFQDENFQEKPLGPG